MKEKKTRQECLEMYSRLELTERMIVYSKAKDMTPRHDDMMPIPLENIAKVLGVDLLPKQPEPIHFTPGVPTEDGWYVCKWGYDYSKEVNGPPMEIYHTIQIKHGHMMFDSACDIHEEAQLHHYTILSHAKLPEL